MQDIQQRKQQWGSLLWNAHVGIYLSFWTTFWLYNRHPTIIRIFFPAYVRNVLFTQKLFWMAALFGFPVWMLIIMRTVRFYYQRQHKKYESQLQLYKSKQKVELETLKKKTNYYQTKALLQRYDDSFASLQDRDNTANTKPNPNSNSNPKSSPNSNSDSDSSSNNRMLDQIQPTKSHSPTLPAVQKSAQSAWTSRMIDSLLLPSSTGANYTGYQVPLFALICSHCHSHNGFLYEKDFIALSCYLCPKCGQLNVKQDEDPLDKSPNPPTHAILYASSDI